LEQNVLDLSVKLSFHSLKLKDVTDKVEMFTEFANNFSPSAPAPSASPSSTHSALPPTSTSIPISPRKIVVTHKVSDTSASFSDMRNSSSQHLSRKSLTENLTQHQLKDAVLTIRSSALHLTDEGAQYKFSSMNLDFMSKSIAECVNCSEGGDRREGATEFGGSGKNFTNKKQTNMRTSEFGGNLGEEKESSCITFYRKQMPQPVIGRTFSYFLLLIFKNLLHFLRNSRILTDTAMSYSGHPFSTQSHDVIYVKNHRK
jgi:hypothetical protein